MKTSITAPEAFAKFFKKERTKLLRQLRNSGRTYRKVSGGKTTFCGV